MYLLCFKSRVNRVWVSGRRSRASHSHINFWYMSLPYN